MPRPASGNPHWEAVAVKLPSDLLAQVRRYADLHRTSVSALLREGLEMRLSGAPLSPDHAGTVIPAATAALLTRLADTLAMVEADVRTVCHGTSIPEEYNGITTTPAEEYNGIPVKPAQRVMPTLDLSKYHLGPLCKRGHDYDGSGYSLKRNGKNDCYQCKKEGRRTAKA